MSARLLSYPIAIPLPEGEARLVLGSVQSGRPSYERRGQRLAIDVRIPNDLARDWYWAGAFLVRERDGMALALADGLDIFERARAFSAPCPAQRTLWELI